MFVVNLDVSDAAQVLHVSRVVKIVGIKIRRERHFQTNVCKKTTYKQNVTRKQQSVFFPQRMVISLGVSLFEAENRLIDLKPVCSVIPSLTHYNKNKEKNILNRFKEKKIQGKKKFPLTGRL